MTDLLRRDQAPIAAAAWAEIDDVAASVLRPLLSGRAIVDVDGPHGWDMAAVNLGRIDVPDSQNIDGIDWGIRSVQPLIELRVPFQLDQWEIDNISRGAKDADLGPLEEAANRLAHFEESLVYNGFANGAVQGMLEVSSHNAISLPKQSDGFPEAIADGIQALQEAGVGGPYALVLGSGSYHELMYSTGPGYPLKRLVSDMLEGGPIKWSPAVSGGVLASMRGGDCELTLGQDISIGYSRVEGKALHLYLTESLTFRVLEPAAAVAFKA